MLYFHLIGGGVWAVRRSWVFVLINLTAERFTQKTTKLCFVSV